MTIEQIAAELYAVPPPRFTAQRDARARELRESGPPDLVDAVKRLRRPTVSAWLVDALVRHRPDEVAALLALGERMRAATAAADPMLRVLAEQRRAAVGGLVAAAREVAAQVGVAVSASAEQEVTSTLEAATASPGAARAVASGRLVRPITYAGFGDVALADVVALPDRLPDQPPIAAPSPSAPPATTASGPTTRDADRAAARAAHAVAARAARDAADAADDAQRRYEQRRAAAQQAATDLDAAGREVGELRERLVAAERRWSTLRAALRDAERDAAVAERAARSAHAAADAARQRLAGLPPV